MTQFPRGRVDAPITSQTQRTVRQGEADADDVAAGAVRLTIRAGADGNIVNEVWGESRLGTGATTVAADPLTVMAGVIVAVECETISMRAEGHPFLVITT